MNGPTHKVGAAAAGVVAAGPFLGLGPAEAAVLAVAATLSAKLPDKDRHYEAGKGGGGGRSVTHSLALGLVLSAALFYWVPYEEFLGWGPLGVLARLVAAGVAVGWMSHLALDALTDERIPVFLPGMGPRFGLRLTPTQRPSTPTELFVRASLAVCLVLVAVSTWGGGIVSYAAPYLTNAAGLLGGA